MFCNSKTIKLFKKFDLPLKNFEFFDNFKKWQNNVEPIIMAAILVLN